MSYESRWPTFEQKTDQNHHLLLLPTVTLRKKLGSSWLLSYLDTWTSFTLFFVAIYFLPRIYWNPHEKKEIVNHKETNLLPYLNV